MTAIPLLCLVPLLAPAPGAAPPAQEDVWSQERLEAVTTDIKREIEKLRGLEFERDVEVALCDGAGFVKYAKERLEHMESPESIAADEAIAKLLGVVPADMDLLAATLEMLEEQVGGFYDPQTDKFYLMESFTGGLAKVIISHELTHALDDQHFDLDGGMEESSASSDRELAYAAVVEGSATAVMNQWTIKNFHELKMDDLSGASLPGMGSLESMPPALWKPMLAAYLRGEAFLRRGTSVVNLFQKKAKPEDIDRAFREPPRSTEQILHPEKYWSDRRRDEPIPVDVAAQGLPEGWELTATDTLGELHLALFTTPFADRKGLEGNQMAVLGIEYTNPAAEGWGGDRAALLSKGDARILSLTTYWDTAGDADEFQAAAAGLADDMSRHLAELCEVRGLYADLRGYRVGRVPDSDYGVTVVSWVGATAADVDDVTAALVVTAEGAEKR